MYKKKNKVITVKYSLTLEKSLAKANAFLKLEPDFKYGYVYIKAPNVNDLFIIFDGLARSCNDKEWNDYYNTYLYPVKN